MTLNLSASNLKTTIGGVLAAVSSAALGMAMTGHLTLNNTEVLIFVSLQAAGLFLLGATAKDSTTHSTEAEVQKSTQEAINKKP
jgi:hypothetical protein